MIKQVIINSKKVPVPIPVHTLPEVVKWITDHLLQKEDTITKIAMNGLEIEDELVSGVTANLSTETVLEFQIDTPFDLMIQSIETIRNYGSILLRSVKQLAVDLWQVEEIRDDRVFVNLKNFQSDLNILLELVDNCQTIDKRFSEYIVRLSDHGQALNATALSIESTVARSDWKTCAKLLLNSLESQVNKLIEDSSVLENDVFIVSSKEGMNIGKF